MNEKGGNVICYADNGGLLCSNCDLLCCSDTVIVETSSIESLRLQIHDSYCCLPEDFLVLLLVHPPFPFTVQLKIMLTIVRP